MQNIVLKEGFDDSSMTSHQLCLPWHVFPVINISSLRKEDGGQSNLLGSVHEVDNVVGVLEVKSTPAPPRLVRVKYSPFKETVGKS